MTESQPSERRSWWRRHSRTIIGVAGLVVVVVFIYRVVPEFAGIGATTRRLRNANVWWLVGGLLLEGLSLAGYVLLFRIVFSCNGVRIGWGASYEITLAGTVATKVFSAAGAGGLALTAWALRASGLSARAVARRLVAFDVILYAVYMVTLIVVGIGLRTGLFGNGGPWALTILPAIVAGGVILIVLSALLVPDDIERRLRKLARGRRRLGRALAGVATIPSTLQTGTRVALSTVHKRPLSFVGALAYWGFDIAVLWVGFKAFGGTPAVAVVILAYFVGALANLLPIPGGVGGVEGATIGTFLAFGTNASAAVLAVLAYRAISFWLPLLPGSVAYLQLRQRVARWRALLSDGSGAREPAPAQGG